MIIDREIFIEFIIQKWDLKVIPIIVKIDETVRWTEPGTVGVTYHATDRDLEEYNKFSRKYKLEKILKYERR